MDYPVHNLVGNIGVVLIVGTYFLVQIGRMSAVQLPYITLNGLGALLILYSLWFDFNLSAFLIEVIWLLISVLGVGRVLLQRRRNAASESRSACALAFALTRCRSLGGGFNPIRGTEERRPAAGCVVLKFLFAQFQDDQAAGHQRLRVVHPGRGTAYRTGTPAHPLRR